MKLGIIGGSGLYRLEGMTDTREEAHQYSIRNVFPRVGETGSTQEIISLLERSLEERNARS